MHYEKTQPGNPRQLTVNQHVFPQRSIARYSDGEGKICVRLSRSGKEVRLSPRNALFCARRAWDQRAEEGFMKSVEDQFQPVADRILSGHTTINGTDAAAISRFYGLWRLRWELAQTPEPDVLMRGVLPGKPLTKDQQECLEKNHYIYSPGRSVLPGRMIAGVKVQVLLDRLYPPGLPWGVVFSRTLEFVVPDTFGTIGILPLSPHYCLAVGAPSGEISAEDVSELNQVALREFQTYCFARDFSSCGL